MDGVAVKGLEITIDVGDRAAASISRLYQQSDSEHGCHTLPILQAGHLSHQ